MKTLQRFPRQITLDELIYLQEASHANHTAWQESEWEKTTTATCGQRCLTLFESFNPPGSWERTFAGLLVGMAGWYSRRCALTWKLVGTPYNRLYFQLAPSTLHTDETEFGLLPTPMTGDYRSQRPLNENNENRSLTTGQKYGIRLVQLAENGMLPTPTASCANAGTEKERPKGQPSRSTELNHLMSQQVGQSSQLNPRFVAEMMGFPPNWTELPFQSGETKA